MTVKFASDKADMRTIQNITDRAWSLPWVRAHYEEKIHLCMDISAVHANGNPLRLDALLEADAFNFAHDIGGICNCLDRATGHLLNGFRPRFSQRSAA